MTGSSTNSGGGGLTDDEKCTLWVGGFDGSRVDQELLYELFINAGPLQSVRIPKNKNFAFVRFEYPESVPYSIDLFRGVELYGQSLKLQNQALGLGMPNRGHSNGGGNQRHMDRQNSRDRNSHQNQQQQHVQPQNLWSPPDHGNSTANRIAELTSGRFMNQDRSMMPMPNNQGMFPPGSLPGTPVSSRGHPGGFPSPVPISPGGHGGGGGFSPQMTPPPFLPPPPMEDPSFQNSHQQQFDHRSRSRNPHNDRRRDGGNDRRDDRSRSGGGGGGGRDNRHHRGGGGWRR